MTADRPTGVDRYIESSPEDARPALRRLRSVIRSAAPDAVEGISYGMPHYRFRGETGVASRLCYFGLVKGKSRIAFYTRPAFLEPFDEKTKGFRTSNSALQFPLNRPLPIRLIQQVLRNGVRLHGRAAA